MLRRILSTLCLAFFAATIALCLRSRSIDDHFGVHDIRVLPDGAIIEHRHGLFSAQGRVSWCAVTVVSPAPFGSTFQPVASIVSHDVHEHGLFHGDFASFHAERDEDFLLGFGSIGMSRGGPTPWYEQQYSIISAPHAFFAVVFLVFPLASLPLVRRRLKNPAMTLAFTYAVLFFAACVAVQYFFYLPFAVVVIFLILIPFIARRPHAQPHAH